MSRGDSQPTILDYGRGGSLAWRNWAAWAGIACASLMPVACLVTPFAFWWCAAGFRNMTPRIVVIAAPLAVIGAIGFGACGMWLAREHQARWGRLSRVACDLGLLNILIAIVLSVAIENRASYLRGIGQRFVRCHNNLRCVGVALLIHVHESKEGSLPSMLEELRAEPFLWCPFTPEYASMMQNANTRTAAPSTYLYFGKGLNKKDLTPQTILACDRPSNHDKPGRELNVLYGDFRIGTLSHQKLEAAIAEIHLGHNPPRAKQPSHP